MAGWQPNAKERWCSNTPNDKTLEGGGGEYKSFQYNLAEKKSSILV